MAAWDQGDLFLVPCLDGSHLVAQVLQKKALPDGVCLCAFTNRPHVSGAVAPLTVDEAISVVFTDASLLNDGTWAIVGLEPIPRHAHFDTPRHMFMDDEPKAPAVIEAFLNAYLGLYPWDAFGEGFFEALLLEGREVPATIRLQASFK